MAAADPRREAGFICTGSIVDRRLLGLRALTGALCGAERLRTLRLLRRRAAAAAERPTGTFHHPQMV